MFKDFDISILADKSMTKEQQEQYGVLGIRIELI